MLLQEGQNIMLLQRVALIYDSRILEHAPPQGVFFYENPERLRMIMQKLTNEGIAGRYF
jgi:hypothetical protein